MSSELFEAGEEDTMSSAIRKAETIGRPLGSDKFLTQAEAKTGRTLKAQKRGRKRKK